MAGVGRQRCAMPAPQPPTRPASQPAHASAARTQREQGLGAAQLCAGARHRQHLFHRHVRSPARHRRRGKRAVAAGVAAEAGEGDEDLGGEGDVGVGGVAGRCCRRHQLRQRRRFVGRKDVVSAGIWAAQGGQRAACGGVGAAAVAAAGLAGGRAAAGSGGGGGSGSDLPGQAGARRSILPVPDLLGALLAAGRGQRRRPHRAEPMAERACGRLHAFPGRPRVREGRAQCLCASDGRELDRTGAFHRRRRARRAPALPARTSCALHAGSWGAGSGRRYRMQQPKAHTEPHHAGRLCSAVLRPLGLTSGHHAGWAAAARGVQHRPSRLLRSPP